MAELSKHSVKRLRWRLGLNKKAAEREQERAMSGIAPNECSGRLRRYLDSMSIERHCDYRVTPAGVFAFSHSDGTLITVLPLPPSLRSTVMTIWGKR